MKELADEILKALTEHYGHSQYVDFIPSIHVSSEDSILSGEYRDDWEEIVLYTSALCFGPEELATVINHEFIHYLQDPKLMEEYNDKFNYYDHPFEMEAYQREEEWRNIPKITSLINNSSI